jgi:hypothetical protein
MTVKLALLKSGEDVIADWHEIVGQDDNVIAYLAKRPYTIKINQTDVPSEDEPASIGLSYFPWMPLSKDTDIPIDPDWVVTLVDPVDQVKESYEEKVNAIQRKHQSDSSDNGTEPDSGSGGSAE